MIFNYNGCTYTGGRCSIVNSITERLNDCRLFWTNGVWRLDGNLLTEDCTASEARKLLTEQIIDQIPRELKYGWLVFNNITDFRTYLESLPLGFDGDNFTLGCETRGIYGRISDVLKIKADIIERVINDL